MHWILYCLELTIYITNYCQNNVGIGALVTKVNLTYLVMYLNWALMLGRCVIRCGFKNGAPKKEKTCFQNKLDYELIIHRLLWIL